MNYMEITELHREIFLKNQSAMIIKVMMAGVQEFFESFLVRKLVAGVEKLMMFGCFVLLIQMTPVSVRLIFENHYRAITCQNV